MIDANEALQLGLVNRVVEPENLQIEGEKLLQEVLRNAPIATNLTWDAVHRGLDLPIDESARLGADYFGLVASTEDFRSGTKGFLRKEEVESQGR